MAAPATEKDDPIEKIIIFNRRATFDYAVEDKYEGGLVLVLGVVVGGLGVGALDLERAVERHQVRALDRVEQDRVRHRRHDNVGAR